MTKVIIGKDCGNSPKNQFLQKLSVAFTEVDADYLLDIIAEEIRWNIIGEKIIQGKADFTKALVQLKKCEVEELTILHALSHGKVGSVHGTKKMNYGELIAYCDVYEFTGAKFSKLNEITSFVVQSK